MSAKCSVRCQHHRGSIGIVSQKKIRLAVWPFLFLRGAHSFSAVTSVQPTQISAWHIARRSQFRCCGRCTRLFSIDTANRQLNAIDHCRRRRIVVVGKIIIDNYGDPAKRSNDPANSQLTVGGGGPQAAWGAAAALAVRHYLLPNEASSARNSTPLTSKEHPITMLPPQQPVTFIAPIGLQNWTPRHATALENLLLPAIDMPPVLISSTDHITPTINIWHDENEIVQWYPVDGSFDAIGADGLWRNRPSSNDIVALLKRDDPNWMFDGDDIVLHCILESGKSPTGNGEDALFLQDSELLNKISVLGIEPIVFPDDTTQKVSDEDGKSVKSLIEKVQQSLSQESNRDNKLLLVTPDRACFDAVCAKDGSDGDAMGHTQSFVSTEIVVRNGAKGSFIQDQRQIPAATLQTPNNKALNPTGAGNAYSAAYVACRGTGSTPKEAAVLATAVGAVVCEYENLPEWTWEVLERVAEAAREVETKLSDELVQF